MLPSKSKMKNIAIFGFSVMAVMAVAPIIMAVLDRFSGGAVGNTLTSVQSGLANLGGVGGPGAGVSVDTTITDASLTD